MLSEKELAFLKELTEQKVPFLIVGLSAAVLQDAPVVTQDVDLWFKDIEDVKIAKSIEKCGGIFIPTLIQFQMPARFGGEDFQTLDLVLEVSGLGTFDEEYKNALEVNLQGIKLKVLPLEKVILSKETVGRLKDKAVLPALKATLAANRSPTQR
ncbi:MAG: hypothetical protein A3G32_01685 [Deltaproteobacteria bacterium RIFCSPLOWO2_12_FULL_40_28]|nr:MAG: hypothetical protein A3C45_06430 [Deltaproteobacteria bacterium RIFCSPHIGHO2_02_FULL_40_28]OGQ18843.1 MAG: hypothetical protein A3E27_09065 [Deltaproteobacteria bacterium RIFCSPHIGHO2_12_FULL_40_32]OGQ40088.1 MAG: hypothetical protein A3I69_01595 [Deltaproteobacteria bacterium RIFCSPLOWO2_02_FULL_40_36]OGQ53271.1 MAG: hypothetical protein A3G32_01685 [Deltaproteobacteria bacterium RIFCSPLOWO2_12_FULL_40_28]